MKIIIKLLTITLIIAGIVYLQGCGENKDDDKTITFWHFWSEPNQRAVIDSIIAVFEKENHCKVKVTELSWNDGKTKLMAAFNSKTAPDVLELGSDWVAQFSSAGVLLELPKDSMNFDRFVEFSKAPSLWESKLFALPWVVDTRVLFYNKDLQSKAGYRQVPPVSFNEILDQAPAINSLPDVYAFGANGSDAHRLYKKVVTFLWSNGGEIFDAQGLPTINDSKNVGALDFYVMLSKNGFLETQRQIDAAFVQGKIAYWISGAWLITKIKNENPSLNYDICEIPQLYGKQGISFAGGEYLAISKQSKKTVLAKKFLEFMTNGKNSVEFCKRINEAGFPADKNYFQDEYFRQNPAKMIFAKQLEHAKMTPVNPHWLEIEEILENATVKALYGEAVSRGALDEAQEQVQMLLEKK
ncbi:MAG: hypothetical protein A2X64_08600 [Ignavibacteria bacterium GWF2_33_9]|nr:MAG: hypothetical protein A2X64_08600 [Ignavibacteria bacterium GWF2_33_9]